MGRLALISMNLFMKVRVKEKPDGHAFDIVEGSSKLQSESIIETRCSMARVPPRGLLDVSASALVD